MAHTPALVTILTATALVGGFARSLLSAPPEGTTRDAMPVPVVDASAVTGQVGIATPRLVGRVHHVVDGDTLDVLLASGPIEVRFANIDAPEHDQPGGEASARALARRLGRNAEVSLEPVKQDDYGRIVAVAYLGAENLEQWMLREGHAWTYRHYARDERYCRWEEEARKARRGLWALPVQQRIAPWDWRHRRRDIEAGTFRASEPRLERCLAEVRRSSR